jgi:DNA relaxase NicK
MTEQKTSIDWLTFRCRNNQFFILEVMRSAFGSAAECLTLDCGIEPKDGWLRAGQFLMGGDIALGRIDYDGESQRGWVRVILTGEGCGWVQDWELVAKWGEKLIDADIRRLDIALTCYKGEITHEMVVQAHTSGLFTSGGRPPVMRTIVSSDGRAGRTVYVGKRESAKFLRCYEKGFELLKDVKKRKDEITHIGGDRVEDIYRVEVEFKAVDKYMPWSSINVRDDCFAAAYPFCASIVGAVGFRKFQALPDFKAVSTLDNALENCRISYGAILRTALEAFDGDRLAVLDRVLALTQSDAMIRAGVLTVAHLK